MFCALYSPNEIVQFPDLGGEPVQIHGCRLHFDESRNYHKGRQIPLGGCKYIARFCCAPPPSSNTSACLYPYTRYNFPNAQEWYLIARVDLHNALKHQATSPANDGLSGPPVKIHTGRTITKLDCETATITLVDGSTVRGDLVVGADGVHSQTRTSVLGRHVPLVNHGKCCYRFLVSVADLLADPETSMFADSPGVFVQISGQDRRICMYPCSSGKVMNVVVFVPGDEVGEMKKGTCY